MLEGAIDAKGQRRTKGSSMRYLLRSHPFGRRRVNQWMLGLPELSFSAEPIETHSSSSLAAEYVRVFESIGGSPENERQLYRTQRHDVLRKCWILHST